MDAGFHTSLVNAREASQVAPTIGNLSGGGDVPAAPGSFKGSGSLVVAAQPFVTFRVAEVEREYYILSQLPDLSNALLYPPTDLAVAEIGAGQYEVTFTEPTDPGTNPAGDTEYALYLAADGGATKRFLRVVPAVGEGTYATTLTLADGIGAIEDIYVQSRLISSFITVSAFTAPVRLAFRPPAPTISAVAGPGDYEVTLTITAGTGVPSGLTLTTVNIEYTGVGGGASSGQLTAVTIPAAAAGATVTKTVTFGTTTDAAYTVRLAATGAWGATAWAGPVGPVTVRRIPVFSGLSAAVAVDGVQVTIGGTTTYGVNTLKIGNNVNLRFTRAGAAPIVVAGALTGASGTITVSRAAAGLTAGVSYAVEAQPLGTFLNGTYSAVTSAITLGLPMTVGGLSAVAVEPSGTVRLSWTAAGTWDSSAPVTGYRVRIAGNLVATVDGGGVTTVDVGGLSVGTTYTFSMTAVNANGESAAAATVTGVPVTYTAPAAPASGDIYQLSDSFGLKFARVVGAGLQPVTGYKIYRSGVVSALATIPQPASGGVTTLFVQFGAGTTAAFDAAVAAVAAGARDLTVVNGVTFTNAANYTFHVVAYNSTGESGTPLTYAATTTIAAPALGFSGLAALASPGSGTYKLAWTRTGAVSTGYPVDAIRLYIGGVKQSSPQLTDSGAVVWTGFTGLSVGAQVAVVAENVVGEGTLSAVAVVPSWSAETAVTGVSGAVGYETLTVTWAAKATTWGLATATYRVECDGLESQTVAADAPRTATFSVVNGFVYRVRVYALNSVGEETPIAEAGPYTIEDAGPVVGTLTAGSHEVTVAWTAKPLTWGVATTEYNIYVSVGGGEATLAATVGAGAVTATLSGLQNFVSTVVSIEAVNAAGRVSPRTSWSAVTLTATTPQIAGAGMQAGLVTGSLRIFKPTVSSNPDGLVGLDEYEVEAKNGGATVTTTISFGAASYYDLGAGLLTNGTEYKVTLRQKFRDVAPWATDIYWSQKTTHVDITPFTPVVAVVAAAAQTAPLAIALSWTVAATVAPYFPSGYYFTVRTVGPSGATTYTTFSDTVIEPGRVLTGLTAGSNTFSLAITTAATAAADIPAGVWSASNSVTVTVVNVPATPTLSNALVFDAAGNATDTFTVGSTGSATRPVTAVKLYDAAGNVKLAEWSGAGSYTHAYTYALSVLGGTKQFYVTATNAAGVTTSTVLTVNVVGSPPYAARDVTAASVTAQDISGGGATMTVSWTRYEPNAVYFPVGYTSIERYTGSAWEQIAAVDAPDQTTGPFDVTAYVVNGQALQLRVKQVGNGGESAGVEIQSGVFNVPAIGAASIGTLSATGLDVTVPWTYSGTMANITGLQIFVGGSLVTTVSAAESGTYAYTAAASGTYAFTIRGVNRFGAGVTSSPAASITVSGVAAPTTYRSISAGNQFSGAVFADGTVRTWGFNASGQLGNGTTSVASTPTTPCNISNASSIACGGAHTGVLLSDGTVRMWGANSQGQLGIGSTTTSQTTPVTPCNISNVVAIACSGHTAVLLADGTVRTWGYGVNGQLGDGSTTASQATAVTVTGVSNAIAIACGGTFTAVLLGDGTMRTWGGGANGQLGIGSTPVSQVSAVTPCNISNVIAISTGAGHTAALLADGTVRTWGYGTQGQLGNGTTTVSQSTPVTATGASNIVAIACGASNTFALRSNNGTFAWGLNDYNQLGLSNTTPAAYSTPTVSSGLGTSLIGIAAGTFHTHGLTYSQTVVSCGWQNVGQLGNGVSNLSTVTSGASVFGLTTAAIARPSFKVASLVAAVGVDISANYFMRIDNGYEPGVVAYRGVAVTAVTGTWEYSTNSGSSWTSVGSISAASALGLRLEPTVRIRCTVAGMMTLKAWTSQLSNAATPATVVSGLDTTVSNAQRFTFSAGTATITAS